MVPFVDLDFDLLNIFIMWLHSSNWKFIFMIHRKLKQCHLLTSTLIYSAHFILSYSQQIWNVLTILRFELNGETYWCWLWPSNTLSNLSCFSHENWHSFLTLKLNPFYLKHSYTSVWKNYTLLVADIDLPTYLISSLFNSKW